LSENRVLKLNKTELLIKDESHQQLFIDWNDDDEVIQLQNHKRESVG
jgi:hypothetical protein